MESLVVWFTDTLGGYISREFVIFIISMIPILELRGGLVAASLLQVPITVAVPICIIGNVIPVPFILLFIRQIFKWMRNVPVIGSIIQKLEKRAWVRVTVLKSTSSGGWCCLWVYRCRGRAHGQGL